MARNRSLDVASIGLQCLVFLAFFTSHCNAQCDSVSRQQKDEFSWEKIVPTKDLIWRDCYSGHQCARLKVPLDYAHPDSDSRSAAIALRRIHSVVPHDSPEYRGPILINPGGPGGSGVDAMGGFAGNLPGIVGPQFDILGFDPRGIRRSTPRVSFFESRAERAFWKPNVPINMNASADAFARHWAYAQLQGQLAGERDDGSLRFVNTDYTARDMMKIVEAHGRSKLLYWGFSYGTTLGATFASIFPDNVERLIIDGNVGPAYYENQWGDVLIDTETGWLSFIEGCVAAGPSGCAFYSPSPLEMKQKVDHLYASIRARPAPVRTDAGYGLVDYAMLRTTMFFALYSPYRTFPLLAQALADLDAGNGTAVFNMASAGPLSSPPFHCECDPSQHRFESVDEAGIAVICNDGERFKTSYEDALKEHLNMSATSNWYELHPPLRIECSTWPEYPKENFKGPMGGNTSFPLLVIGNTADPVCPLWASHKMSDVFPGSVVLTQDSPGHCSVSAPSICTQKYVREYFINGTLPPLGTVCPVIGSPFPPINPGVDADSDSDAQMVFAGMSAVDRDIWDSVNELAMRTFVVPFKLGGMR
ncbi:TAP-like protein-domain-containing protein [Roridomyces roridus]|uniref:TAP-like protein-domain-containing protein n=1 Tax=Roridomyces roridus TaxID=1738132 RepID=A0AAD7BZT5_9AGAR|nr:TAP-like protein-domain-containing protein [Roridomyces roridus]